MIMCQEIHEPVAVIPRWTQPRNNGLGAVVYAFHHEHQFVLFLVVFLVDADCVDPERDGLILAPEMTERDFTIGRYLEFEIVQTNLLRDTLVAPGIRECDVRGGTRLKKRSLADRRQDSPRLWCSAHRGFLSCSWTAARTLWLSSICSFPEQQRRWRRRISHFDASKGVWSKVSMFGSWLGRGKRKKGQNSWID